MNCDDGYDDGDNNRKKYGDDDNNSDTRSVSDGSIFDQITTHRSCGQVLDENGDIMHQRRVL